MTDLRKTINSYYGFRGLKAPDALEAFLFLLSEVGELAEALLENRDFPDVEKELDWDCLQDAMILGRQADRAVSERGGWVRNHGRKGSMDLPGEFGDCLMMLDRTAEAMGYPALESLLIEKMKKKGFSSVMPVDSVS